MRKQVMAAAVATALAGPAVALAQVAAVQSLPKGDATVVLKSGAQVPCSRQFRAALKERLVF